MNMSSKSSKSGGGHKPSGIVSTLVYAASFALPSSRSSSPASHGVPSDLNVATGGGVDVWGGGRDNLSPLSSSSTSHRFYGLSSNPSDSNPHHQLKSKQPDFIRRSHSYNVTDRSGTASTTSVVGSHGTDSDEGFSARRTTRFGKGNPQQTVKPGWDNAWDSSSDTEESAKPRSGTKTSRESERGRQEEKGTERLQPFTGHQRGDRTTLTAQTVPGERAKSTPPLEVSLTQNENGSKPMSIPVSVGDHRHNQLHHGTQDRNAGIANSFSDKEGENDSGFSLISSFIRPSAPHTAIATVQAAASQPSEPHARSSPVPIDRSFSYQELSPPSPSSYGPKTDWTMLENKEIQDAQRAFEGMKVTNGNDSVGHGRVKLGGGEKGRTPTTSGSIIPSVAPDETTVSRAESKLPNDTSLGSESIPGPSSGKNGKYGKEALRPEMEEILKDPLWLLKLYDDQNQNQSLAALTSSAADGSRPPPPLRSNSSHADITSFNVNAGGGLNAPSIGRKRSVRTERRREKFASVLRGKARERYGSVDPTELRKMAWSGIPQELRPIVWQMLLSYLPLPAQPRLATLARKRKEYAQLVEQAFGRGMSQGDISVWHQIEIDVPRTRPGVPLWSCETTQRSLERILYVWAIRHPASGYVQGINDLVTPFFEVFLSAYIDCDPELFDASVLPNNILAAIEADSFWCLSKLLDGIQDNYISAQPGIHRLVRRMADLIKRIDAPLANHLEEQGVEYMQFAFRWMNCLLMRELSVKCTIRMWDTYLTEGTDAFSQFHLYVCSAFLVKWSEQLKSMDFQEIIMFLQCLPTQKWTDHEVELLLSEAFVLKSVWQGAENHFTGSGAMNAPLGGGMGGR